MASEQELYQQYLKETGQVPAGEQELYQQYLKETGAAPQTEEQIINEMPEGLKGRFAYKNFAADPEAGFNFLQKENPEFELKKDASGEILARKRGAQVYGRLDPKGFDWRDLTDIAYDVPAGIVQGTATAASGLAGALAGGGIGAVPAAMAGSAASGAGIEALRQGIGATMMGTENFDPSKIGTTAVIGAASPLVFGAGIGGKQALNAAVKSGGAKTAQELIKAGRGAVGRTFDATVGKVLPKTLSALGGYSEETLQAAQENLPLIARSKNDPAVAMGVLSEGKDKIFTGLRSSLNDTGSKIEALTQSLDAQGAVIPTKNILDPIFKLKNRLETTGIQSESRKELINRLQSMVDENFTVNGVIPENVSATQANEAYFTLKSLAEDSGANYSKAGQLKGMLSGNVADKRVSRALLEATKNAKNEIGSVAKTAGVGKDFTDLNASYSELKNFQELFNKATKDEDAYQTFLKKSGPTSDYAKQQVSKMIGEDVNKLGAKMQAIQLFAKPQWEIPAFGASNTGRTATSAGLGGTAAYLMSDNPDLQSSVPMIALGAALGSRAMGPVAVKKYLQGSQLIRQLPQSGPSVLGATPYNIMPYSMMNMYNNDQGEK